ncbi:MAG: class beta-lactamase-related serine hydrolase [Mucilaginibacter sp.]|nr:class beta-lactamase-related serine hydrolase [Mucilaginibacter sp.]
MFTIKFYLFASVCLMITVTCFAQTKVNNSTPTGFLTQDIKSVDSLVYSFIKKYHVPGLSFAIAKNDSLKIRRCYGYADTFKHILMTPDNRFRIASISKPFTSTAIMLLIEQGELHLKDKVFGNNALLATKYGTYPYKKWVIDVTVEDLLEHLCGGWANDHNDPMFLHPEMSQAQLINWTLNNQPLQNKPGTHFQYSNFGFCILGRVIEKVSGSKYEEFVRKNVLIPCGITSMEIGGNTLAERKSKEVYYYDKQQDPYTMDEKRMDAHGGWIATPTDLIKFLVRVDKFPQKPDILKPATLDSMFTPSVAGSGYAKGWAVNQVNNYWHNGSLPGQQSIAVRTNDNYCWAIMVNTRADGNFSADLDELMWKIRFTIKQWPRYDLLAK